MTLVVGILWAFGWVVLLAVALGEGAVVAELGPTRESGRSPSAIRYMTDQPRRLFVALLLARDAALVALGGAPAIGFAAGGSLLWLGLGPASFLLAYATSASARSLAAANPGLVAPFVPILRLAFALAGAFRRALAAVLPPEVRAGTILGEDPLERLEGEHAETRLDVVEEEILHRLSAFGETTVRAAMTPRLDVLRLPLTADRATVEKAIRETRRSRIPVYDRDPDEVVGLLYAKDLVGEVGDAEPDLRRHLREARFVPLAKPIDELFREFRRDRVHAAVVVDEYGAFAGLVTMEDLLEELFGEMRADEGRGAAEPEITLVEDGVWRASGRLPIRRLVDEIGLAVPPIGAATVGGLVIGRLGRLPREGDRVPLGDFLAVVESVRGFALERLRIERWTPR